MSGGNSLQHEPPAYAIASLSADAGVIHTHDVPDTSANISATRICSSSVESFQWQVSATPNLHAAGTGVTPAWRHTSPPPGLSARLAGEEGQAPSGAGSETKGLLRKVWNSSLLYDTLWLFNGYRVRRDGPKAARAG